MEVSKVKFSQETLAALNSRPLNKIQKAHLRQERIKDYIRSKPAGTKMPMTELAVAGGYRGKAVYGAGWGFVDRLIKNGAIIKNSEGPNMSTWSIPQDAKTVKPPDPKPGVKPATPPIWSLPTYPDTDLLTKVTGLAKDFVWKRNSDSLRDFVKWLADK